MANKKSNLHISQFAKRVYHQLRQIPPGRVITYGDLAKRLGKPQGARAVGQALNRNPDAPDTPCHRVIYRDGAVGGYARGTNAKIELLRSEGIIINKSKIDLRKYRYFWN